MRRKSCIHLAITSAFRKTADKGVISLDTCCTFGMGAQDRLGNCPAWLLRSVAYPHLVRPERDCAACPAYEEGGDA